MSEESIPPLILAKVIYLDRIRKHFRAAEQICRSASTIILLPIKEVHNLIINMRTAAAAAEQCNKEFPLALSEYPRFMNEIAEYLIDLHYEGDLNIAAAWYCMFFKKKILN